MPTFPSAPFPQEFVKEGYSSTPKNFTVYSPSGAPGPTLARRRSAQRINNLRGQMKLTEAQVDQIETFYYDTCYSGATRFDWTRSTVASQRTYRFMAPPAVTSQVAPGYFMVAFSMEEEE